MPFLRLQLDSATGSKVQEAEKQFGERSFFFVFLFGLGNIHIYEGCQKPQSSSFLLDLFTFIPCVLFANAALNYTAYAIFFFFSISFILGFGFATLLYATLQLNQGPNKEGFIKNKREKQRLLISLNNVFFFVFKEAFV